jgi:hypothetical protein
MANFMSQGEVKSSSRCRIERIGPLRKNNLRVINRAAGKDTFRFDRRILDRYA